MAAHQAPRPWDSPGKNTGVGCHFLLQCMKVKSEREVAQSCLTLSDPLECSLPGSPAAYQFSPSIGFSRQEYCSELPLPSPSEPLGKPKNIGIAYPFSRGSSWLRNWTGVSCIAGGVFTTELPGQLEVLVTQSYPTLCDSMDCSLPGFSVHGILQARILEWVVMPSFRVSSRPSDQTWVSCITGTFFTIWATREAQKERLPWSGNESGTRWWKRWILATRPEHSFAWWGCP